MRSSDLPAPPDATLIEGMEEYEVNECSGHPTWHQPSCKENCKKVEMPRTAMEIRNELNAWTRAGMQPEMVPHNVFNMDVQLFTLIRIVVEVLGVDQEEIDERYRKNLLDKLRVTREQNEDNVRRARALQKITVPGQQPPPDIFGPNGGVIR